MMTLTRFSSCRASAVTVRGPAVTLAFATAMFAQQPAPPPPPPATDDEAIVLTPFTVNTSKDRGYQAENTLSGSRLNSSLNDTPASVSVFTKEFLQDVGLTELRELVEYSVSATLNFNDTGPETNANSYVNATALTRKIDIRGLINQTSKQAQARRDAGTLRYSFGTEHRNRSELDYNRVLLKDRLAVLVAAVHQENGGWQTHDFQDRDRIYGSVFIRPTSKLVINVMGETGNEKSAVIAPFTAGDEVLAWYDNRQARGVAAVTVAPNNVTPTAAQQALGITARSANLTGAGIKRVTYINNDGTVFNSAGTFITGSYNNPAVRAPDGQPGVSGTQLRLNDQNLMPYSVNAAGPAMYRDQKLKNYTVTADWQLAKNLFLNLARNYQSTSARVYFVNAGNPILRGDPNTTIGVRGPVNPYAGQLYFDANWKLDYHDATHEENRVSLSYQLDTRRFGTHRFAAMASRAEDSDYRLGTWLGLAGAPFGGDADNINNRITTRYYVTEGNPESFVLGDWRQVPSRITADGVPYDVIWVNQAPGNQNALAEQKVDSLLGVVQSHFFNHRLVTTLGYREDEAEIVSFGHSFHPTLKMAMIDKDPAKAVTNNTRAIARSQGVVWHALPNVSLLANASTSVALPDFRRKVLPDSKVAAPARGKGEDIGVSVSFLDRRLTAKAVYYTTSERGSSTAGQVVFADTNNRVVGAFAPVLAGPGRPLTQAEWNTRAAAITPDISGVLFDTESEGYEFSATANPTPNWRVTLNYAHTDRVRTNSFTRDVVPWYGFQRENGLIKQGVRQNADGTFTLDPSAFESSGTVATWIALSRLHPDANLSTLTTQNGISIAQEVFNLIQSMNADILENEQRWGLRPDRANIFTAYDFTQGALKGITIGGGYRWRSANIIGSSGGGAERKGRAIEAADLLLRYRHKLAEGRFRGTLVFQVNVMNLFNETGIIPTHISSTTDFHVPGRGIGYSRFALVQPRSVRFTTSYAF